MASNPSYEQSKQVAEASREAEWKQPSFGRELFLGDFRLDLIHPQPPLDPAGSGATGCLPGKTNYLYQKLMFADDGIPTSGDY